MTTEPKSATVILTGLYFILIGAFWTTNTSFYKFEQNNANRIYAAGIETLKSAEETAATHKFTTTQRVDYQTAHSALSAHLSHFKKHEVDSIPLSSVTIGILAFITSLAYISCGIYIFRRSKDGATSLKLGILGFVTHYFLIVGDFLLTIPPILTKATNLIKIFEPLDPFWMVQGWGPQVLVFIIISIVFSTLFYIFIPTYLVKRPRLTDQLLQTTDASPAPPGP